MSADKNSNSYKIGFIIGTLIQKFVVGFVKMIWAGTVKASKGNRILQIIYLSLAVITLILLIFTEFGSIPFTITLLVALIFGIKEHIKERPTRKKRKYFNKLFTQLNFSGSDDNVPCYLSEQHISEFTTKISFNTVIPLEIWESKKELLEMHMNVRIKDIKQDHNDYRIINLIIQTQALPSIIHWDDEYIEEENNVLNIGIGTYGTVGMDLGKYPHAFIAGETGSGKSNILKCMIHQSIMKDYDIILIDFKRGVSFSAFSEVVDIYYEYKTVIGVIKELVKETKKRLDIFRENKVDNLNDYNRFSAEPLSRKIVFIDELAELLRTRDKEISNILNDSIETLTRLSRAVGIHLIMGIQRPDSTIISGQIKNNVPFRICGRFTDKEPSRIMLTSDIASTLQNIKGRFIVKGDEIEEIQSFYFTNEVRFIEPEKSALEDVTEDLTTEKEEAVNTNITDDLKEQEEPKLTKTLDFDFSDI